MSPNKACGEAEENLHAVLPSALDENEELGSRADRFTPRQQLPG
jgi:hypothetical protein